MKTTFRLAGPSRNTTLFVLCCSIGTLWAKGQQVDIVASENVTEKEATEFDAMAIDDFILLTLNEYGDLFAKNLITFNGFFGDNGLWLVDNNGTNYLLIARSHQETKSEWESALGDRNSTDNTVCVDDVCVATDVAIDYIGQLEGYTTRQLPVDEVPRFAALVTVFIIIGITGVTGNGLILLGILRSKSRRNSTNVLICSLGASDVIVLSFCLPMQVVNKYFYIFPLPFKTMCFLLFSVRYFSMAISVLTMSAVALERYIAVCYPLKAKSYCTSRNAFISILVMWPLAFAASYPVTLFLPTDPNDYRCFMQFSKVEEILILNLAVTGVVFVLPLCIMLPLYMKIFFTLWRSIKDSEKMSGYGKVQAKDVKRAKTRLQVMRMMLFVLMTFIVSWGPTTIFGLVYAIRLVLGLERVQKSATTVHFVLNTLGICNSFFNPMVYTTMSRQHQAFLMSFCPVKVFAEQGAIHSVEGDANREETVEEQLSELKRK